jgi:hypothetical protein
MIEIPLLKNLTYSETRPTIDHMTATSKIPLPTTAKLIKLKLLITAFTNLFST